MTKLDEIYNRWDQLTNWTEARVKIAMEEYGKYCAEQARKGEYEWNIERKKIKKICSLCGSEEVLVDAYAQWDVEKQKFVLNSTFGHSFCFCNACERECQIIDEEMKYGE